MSMIRTFAVIDMDHFFGINPGNENVFRKSFKAWTTDLSYQKDEILNGKRIEELTESIEIKGMDTLRRSGLIYIIKEVTPSKRELVLKDSTVFEAKVIARNFAADGFYYGRVLSENRIEFSFFEAAEDFRTFSSDGNIIVEGAEADDMLQGYGLISVLSKAA